MTSADTRIFIGLKKLHFQTVRIPQTKISITIHCSSDNNGHTSRRDRKN